MPTVMRKVHGRRIVERFRTQRHVDAQAALNVALSQIDEFERALGAALPKSMRGTVSERCGEARCALQRCVLNDPFWSALDTGDAVGAPWDSNEEADDFDGVEAAPMTGAAPAGRGE